MHKSNYDGAMKNFLQFTNLRRPEILLFLMAAAVPISFATWQALINNFAHDRAAFGGVEIGTMQSVREIPGFLAFAVVFIILFIREQKLALVSLFVLGLGTAITGAFPSTIGIYITTLLMSTGYHYYSTLQTSLSLQWISKEKAPETLGRIIAVGSFISILVFALIWLSSDILSLDYYVIYLIAGGTTMVIAGICWMYFPQFPQPVEQHKHMVLRKRYWLYYALTFMSGARRQIFIVFAGFLMVEKFNFDVADIAALFLVNACINIWLAPKIGRLIARIGEKPTLIIEYIGLIAVFTGYGLVEQAEFAAALYIIDHLFFAMAIAIETYFQKIAEPADIASTIGISFTINHIAAVVIPITFGFIWVVHPSAVFYIGAVMAAVSLVLAFNVPRHPKPGTEVLFGKVFYKPTTAVKPV